MGTAGIPWQPRGNHGNGDHTHGKLWGRGHVSQGYRGMGSNADGNTAVKWKKDEQ